MDNSMSFKAKMRNLANAKGITAQVVLQNYMFERFLIRLSLSEYVENYVIKCGLLIAAFVGLDKRSTMDLDTTIINAKLNEDFLMNSISSICSIDVDDKVTFIVVNISNIRKDNAYGGYRVSIEARYENIVVPLQIDVTTGDVITPREKIVTFKQLFNEGVFKLKSYSIETILAEKVETILSRAELNTRPRDFYDVYILTKTQLFNKQYFLLGLENTSRHRGSEERIKNISEILEIIESDIDLRKRWDKYSKEYKYANGISYEDINNSLRKLLEI